MNADKYLPVLNSNQIPLGELASVGGTVFDMRIGKKLKDQLPNCPGGPDHIGYNP